MFPLTQSEQTSRGQRKLTSHLFHVSNSLSNNQIVVTASVSATHGKHDGLKAIAVSCSSITACLIEMRDLDRSTPREVSDQSETSCHRIEEINQCPSG